LHVAGVLILSLEAILHELPLLVGISLASALESFVGRSLLNTLLVILVIHHLILVPQANELLLLHLDIFGGQMLTGVIISCEPWVYERFLNVYRSHFLMAPFSALSGLAAWRGPHRR